MAYSTKTLVLAAAAPFTGHVMPIRAIAKNLISRGYEVTFITASHYRKLFEDDGASFVPLSGYADVDEKDIDIKWPARSQIPAGPPRFLYDFEHVFVNSMPSQFEACQRALKMLHEKHPGRPIVWISEFAFFGTTPVLAGAPGLKPTGSIFMSIAPVVLSSQDCAPFGLGLPPDSSPEGREKNKAMNKTTREQFFGGVQKRYEEPLDSLGATISKKPFFLDVEYPRSNAPSTIRFTGGLPKGARDPYTNTPSWSSEVTENTNKKIVAVSQGTAALNYDDLVIPTMTALKDRKDILVVVALGKKGASLPPSTIPPNARVADFIPYDALLPHSVVFITNGGYGGLQTAIVHGTPVIIAGGSEDKPEVAARAEWAGLGINLKTGTPTSEAVEKAVDEVIGNPRFRERAVVLQGEMETFDTMQIVADTVDELGGVLPN